MGGTVFLGRHMVEAALARGWDVTAFNRGVTGTDVPGAESVRGDRESAGDLARLAGLGPWDAVVDVCGYVPRVVGESVRALSPAAGTYAFVSSVSAYAFRKASSVDEHSPRLDCPADAGPEDGNYGELKAGCERAVEEGFEGTALIINPGLIVGPHENVGRIPYWLRRAARGGPFIAPGHPDRSMQLIDARDIAEFTMNGIEKGYEGRYFTTGIHGNVTWGELISTCVEATGSDAEPVWIDDDFLLDHEVGVWDELPLWAPARPDFAGVWLTSSGKALEAGLSCRAVEDSIRDTWTWLGSGDVPDLLPSYRERPRVGIAEEKERDIITAWRNRR
ncbi:reductase [Wenjunlia tyrosinilytica]|uniref:Reductase n=2 Tax=Wenjunlia tyrosinilytica TaxID=1544741 RepID=A0A918DXK2_9ACTN|nr:reductase [Wenjunlia tyrosinilytica]